MEEQFSDQQPMIHDRDVSEDFNQQVDWAFDFLASIVGNFASNLAPLLAGILPAYLTWKHIVETLGFPTWVAWSGAGLIEFMGLGAGTELMKVWSHNRTYRDEKARMPFLAPGGAAGWYVAIMVAFNIILEAFPESQFWRIFSIALFATLAIPGYALVAGKALRREWEMEHQRALLKRRAERRRAGKEQSGEQGANGRNSPQREEQWEYASAYAEQVESILERVWNGTGKIATPSYIVRVLNENGASLDVRKSSGYVSTLSKNWRIARGIQLENRDNGGVR